MEQLLEVSPVGTAVLRRSRTVMVGVVTVLAAATGFALLWQARTVAFHYLGLEFAVAACLAVWVALELGWGLVRSVRGLDPGDRRPGGLPGRRLLLAWFGLVVVLVALKAPVYVNLLASQAALTEQVRAVQAGQVPQAPQRVGGFDVERAFPTEAGCVGSACEVVLVVGDGPAALVWSGSGEPRYRLSDSNGHLVGPWSWSIEE